MASKIKAAARHRETRVAVSDAPLVETALSPDQRKTLLSELQAATSRIEQGAFVCYDREDQLRRFEKVYSGRE
jgi:hypothetical protein